MYILTFKWGAMPRLNQCNKKWFQSKLQIYFLKSIKNIIKTSTKEPTQKKTKKNLKFEIL